MRLLAVRLAQWENQTSGTSITITPLVQRHQGNISTTVRLGYMSELKCTLGTSF